MNELLASTTSLPNLHPAIVHFPIALAAVALVVDLAARPNWSGAAPGGPATSLIRPNWRFRGASSSCRRRPPENTSRASSARISSFTVTGTPAAPAAY